MPLGLLDNQVCDNPQSFIFNISCFFIILRLLRNNLGRFLSLREEILPTLKARYDGVVLDMEERNGQ